MDRALAETWVVCLLVCSGSLRAADWPMWRYDAARTAATPEELPNRLVRLWTRKLPPVQPAWPLEPNRRIDFDASYEPVVMGKRLFLGSPNDGSVKAYDTETGEELWAFYTEGPVRCAPVCWTGRVSQAQGVIYVGSDDGYLYCLEAQTGRLIWKFRGAPKERPDRRHLGNGHLVSFWPVRGGPVLKDGVVYFGAGNWPIFGVFIHALDARTGQVKWTNSELDYLAGVRGQGSLPLDTGVSPQGYLALLRDRLAVPCGRSLPAGLDATTGKLVHYDQGGRRGDSRVALYGDYAFVGKDAIMTLDDFREFGNPSQGALPIFYKMAIGCEAASAFSDGVAYGFVNGVFYAYDVSRVAITEREGMGTYGPIRTPRWEPVALWQYQTPFVGRVKRPEEGIPGRLFGFDARQKGDPVIKAGARLYGAVGRKVVALENLSASPRIAWDQELEGTPTSLVAADGKLFVALAEGGLVCLGEGHRGPVLGGTPTALASGTNAWTDKARQIVATTGAQEGYCLVLGLTDGGLIEELLKQTRLLMLVVDADPNKVEALRRRLDKASLLGSRVWAFVGRPFAFGFPPYLASLIVSEDAAADFSTNLVPAEVFRLLRPYGGALCLELPEDSRAGFAKWAAGVGEPSAKARQSGSWSLLVSEGALAGTVPWTHEGYDAANTYCSKDERVKAPLGFLWYGDVPMPLPRDLTYIRMGVNGGRVYMHGIHSTNLVMTVYDAYTGRLLWTNEVFVHQQRAVAAFMEDGVYVVAGGQCKVYDPTNGAERKSFVFLTNTAWSAQGLRVADDVVLVSCNEWPDPWRKWPHVYDFTMSRLLMGLDRATGNKMWQREARERFHERAMAIGRGRVFCVDSIPLSQVETQGLKQVTSTVLALDARTGRELWRQAVSYDGTNTSTAADYADGVDDYHVHKLSGHDWLAYAETVDIVVAGRFLCGVGLDAQTGAVRWGKKEVRGAGPVMVCGGRLVTSGGYVYDVLTGEQQKRYSGVRKRSCGYPIGSTHVVMTRMFCNATYYDVDQDRTYSLRNIRPSCLYNLLAADGLVNSPCFTPGDCICNFPIQTSFALVHMPEVAGWAAATPRPLPPLPAPPTPKTQP